MTKCSEKFEKQLFLTCLDLKYSYDINEGFLQDLRDNIKELKKQQNKTKRALKKVIEHYKSIYNREPNFKRK